VLSTGINALKRNALVGCAHIFYPWKKVYGGLSLILSRNIIAILFFQVVLLLA